MNIILIKLILEILFLIIILCFGLAGFFVFYNGKNEKIKYMKEIKDNESILGYIKENKLLVPIIKEISIAFTETIIIMSIPIALYYLIVLLNNTN